MQIPINPLTNQPLPIGPNSRAFVGGRSLLDNIYGASSDPSIQANPPSRFRTNMMSGFSFNPDIGQGKRRTFTNRDMSQFVDPNIDNPLLRNYPALRKIPENQRQFAKIVDGKVVLDLPEEMEMGTQNQTDKVSSNIPQFDTEQEYLKASGLLDQQEKQPTTGLLGNEEETKKETKGLLDTAKDFVGSTYGRNFAMGILRASGYSTSPKTLGQIIGEADEYATNKELAQEKLDIEKMKANKLGGGQEFAYVVRDPNTGKVYNAFKTKNGEVSVDVDGVKKPFRTDMFGGEVPAQISTVGNLGNTNITGNKFFELGTQIETYENQLGKLAKYMQNMKNAPVGMEKLATQFGAYMNTILGKNDLTPEQLKQRILEGEFQGLIGANRLEVVGGGVMTEQDALRIILALGGDPSSISTNPEVVISQMSTIFGEKYNLYKNALDVYNLNVTQGGFAGYPKKEEIKFNDFFLQTLNPSTSLALNLTEIPEFTESMLLRLLEQNLDSEGEVIEDAFSIEEKQQIIKRAKELGIDITFEDL